MADGSVSAVSDGEQAGVASVGGNGSVVVRTVNGGLTLPGDSAAVSAHGGGNVLLLAGGSVSDLVAHGDVVSGTGHVTLFAGRSVTFAAGADVFSGGAGTVFVQAGGGSISMAGASRIETGGGDIRMEAAGNVSLGRLATTGNVSITAEAGSVWGNGGGEFDVVANGLRLTAGNAVGGFGEGMRLTTKVATMSARAGGGGVNILEADALLIGDVAAAVRRVGADGLDFAVGEAPQSGVVTSSNNGSIVVRTENGSVTVGEGTGVSAHGAGVILVEAGGASADLTVNGDVVSGRGHVRLLAGRSVTFGAGANVVSGGAGTLSVEAVLGSIAMADGSRIDGGAGDARLLAAADVRLAGVRTLGNVSITATAGSIFGGGGADIDVVASGLRLVAGVGIGTAANALETAILTLSARASGGGIYVTGTGGFRVGDVAVAIQRVNPSSSVFPIVDATQSGVRTTGGNGVIVLRALSGNLVVAGGGGDLEGAGIVAHGGGAVTLSTGAGGNVELLAAVRSGTGAISILSVGNIRHDFGGVGPVVRTGGAISLRAESGIGQSGRGSLFTKSIRLSVSNRQNGSVYIRLDETTPLHGVELLGSGSFFLNQTGGDLSVVEPVVVADGHLNIVSRGTVTVAREVSVFGNIDIAAQRFTAAGAAIKSAAGDIRIRAVEAIQFDGVSPLTASEGGIWLRSGADVSVGRAVAGGVLEIVAAGTIVSSLPGNSAGALEAGHLRLHAGGTIGTAAAPVFFDAERVDVDAGGMAYVRSLGEMVLGRFGMAATTAPGQELVIWIEGGKIRSEGGQLVDKGNGTLVLRSENEFGLDAVVRSENGHIRIEARKIVSESTAADGRVEAPNGSVRFEAEEGIGGAGANEAVHFHAPQVSATTGSGPLHLNSLSGTTVGGAGLVVNSGSGLLRLNVAAGSLTTVGNIRHLGSGSVAVNVAFGGISMTAASRISTVGGALTLAARDDVWLSRVQTASGLVRVSSASRSVQGMANIPDFAGANIVVSGLAPAPILQVASRAILTVYSDMVTVNGSNFFRVGRPAIPINLNFST